MKRVVRYYLGATFVWSAEENTWHGAVMGMPVYIRNLGSRYEIAICRACGLKAYYTEPTIKKAFFRILVHFVESNRKLFYTNLGFRRFRIVRAKIDEWILYHNFKLIATFWKSLATKQLRIAFRSRKLIFFGRGDCDMMSIKQGYTMGFYKVVTYRLVWDGKVVGLAMKRNGAGWKCVVGNAYYQPEIGKWYYCDRREDIGSVIDGMRDVLFSGIKGMTSDMKRCDFYILHYKN